MARSSELVIGTHGALHLFTFLHHDTQHYSELALYEFGLAF